MSIALLLAATAAALSGANGPDNGPCTAYAAPGGFDGAAGTRDDPLGTVRGLSDALEPGGVGCLLEGSYRGNVTVRRGGTAARRITIRSAPDERATVIGRLVVAPTAAYTTFRDLRLVGLDPAGTCTGGPCPSPTINAADVWFLNNDVSNDHTAICFAIGDVTGVYGRADRAVLRGNRIHACGSLPRTNREHGIYLQATDQPQVSENWIYDNADRGIQLYPDVQRATITGNVIVGNGSGIIFSGDGALTSRDNLVEGNVIVDSRARWNVESYYAQGTRVGTGNVVRRNCLAARDPSGPYGEAGGDAHLPGYVSTANRIVADPGLLDPASGDLRLRAGSRCRGVLRGALGR